MGALVAAKVESFDYFVAVVGSLNGSLWEIELDQLDLEMIGLHSDPASAGMASDTLVHLCSLCRLLGHLLFHNYNYNNHDQILDRVREHFQLDRNALSSVLDHFY